MHKDIVSKTREIKKIYKALESKLISPVENFVSYLDNLFIIPIHELISKYLYSRIVYHYGASYRVGNSKSQNLDFKTKNLGYGQIHYSLILNIRPEKVLCVGSMYGYVPFMCALACKDNKKGTVDFVDAGYDINNPKDVSRHNWGQGFWKKVSPKVHFSFFKTDKYINTYVDTTKKFAKKFPKNKYEYIYIDGDHSYEGVKTDYKLFWPMLKKGGFMAFHDTDNSGVHGTNHYDVTRFCKEFIYSNKNFFHFPNPESGLVIVQKR
jgi:hypothetical protein